MTFKALQDEVIALRFSADQRASIKSWLNIRYAALWDKADWHFKHVKGANLAVVAGNPKPTMPADFAKSEGLYDNLGQRLRYLRPDRFRDLYSDPTAVSQPSSDYTVIAREIYLGATPSGNATFTLAYERRVSHIDGGTGLSASGVMVNDTDTPIWGAEYDYLLVLDAAVLGGTLLDDLGTDAIKAERDDLLASMTADLVGGEDNEILEQWGGEPGGNYFGTSWYGYGASW